MSAHHTSSAAPELLPPLSSSLGLVSDVPPQNIAARRLHWPQRSRARFLAPQLHPATSRNHRALRPIPAPFRERLCRSRLCTRDQTRAGLLPHAAQRKRIPLRLSFRCIVEGTSIAAIVLRKIWRASCLRSAIEGLLYQRQERGMCRARQRAFSTSAFSMFAGRCPLNKATTFSAAMHAILVRVSSDPEAMCGASTTLGRFSPG